MKNKFTKLISSVLIFAFLLSACAVLASANDTGNTTGGEVKEPVSMEDVTLLINRTFDEGWSAQNGFNAVTNGNLYDITYEEIEDFSYNYFMRVEAINQTASYLNIEYGNNVPQKYSVLEFDINADDIVNLGTGSVLSSVMGKTTVPLMRISSNTIYLPGTDGLSGTTASGVTNFPNPSYQLGHVGDEWLHIAFVMTIGARLCPVCGKVMARPETAKDTDFICCPEENGGVKLADMAKVLGLRVYYGYSDTFNLDAAVEQTSSPYGTDKPADMQTAVASGTYYYDTYFNKIDYFTSMRLGTPATSTMGHSYLIDNLRFYNGAYVPLAADAFGGESGANVDATQAKTVEIRGGEKTALQYVKEGLIMKVGSTYALSAGQRILLEDGTQDNVYSGPAIKIDGKVYVPLQAILNWIGYPMFTHEDGISYDIATENGSTFITVGRNSATANGELVPLEAAPILVKEETFGNDYICVALNDIENLFKGYYVTYDDMGLLAISQGENLFKRESDLQLMLDVMRMFVYGENTGYYEQVRATTGFDHPYLVANDDDFQSIRDAYNAPVGNEPLKSYINKVLADAEVVYNNYAVESGNPATNNGKLLRGEVINPREGVDENAGYASKGGRLDEIVEFTEQLQLLAFAYQMNRDVKYARLAYEFAVSLSKWEHWGPAYIINCADATANYALAYDWLYDAWTGEDELTDPWTNAGLDYDVSVVEEAIYKFGVSQGYASATGAKCDFPRNQADQFTYTNVEGSWNIIASSGMVIGSLAIIGGDEIYRNAAEWLIKNNVGNLMEYGLEGYSRGGSYMESPYYWAYATNALSLMSWCMTSATGSDQGIMNSLGVSNSFYFACQSEFSSGSTEDGYQYWNFNESPNGVASQNTSFFYYAAGIYKDSALAALRNKQIAKKGATIWDVLAYNAEYDSLSANNANLSLDYIYGINEGVSSRSDWEDGSLFVGIMNDRNDTYLGQIDSGNFIYANKNHTWFVDMGGETIGADALWDTDYRYGYYKNNAEGANTIFLGSEGKLPQGQLYEAGGTMVDYKNNENGMYYVIDNTAVYGDAVSSAKRGLLLTNDRKTVVIQDEIAFNGMRTAYWVAHTADKINIREGGRVATMNQVIDGKMYMLRMTLVSSNQAFQFTTESATSRLLAATFKSDQATKNFGEAESLRNDYSRLVIKTPRSLAFNVAVVIELLDSSAPNAINSEVQYEYKEMLFWNESMLTSEFVPSADLGDTVGNTDADGFFTNAVAAGALVDDGYAFSSRTDDFFRLMAYCARFVTTFAPVGVFDSNSVNYISSEVEEAYVDYQKYKVLYDNFRSAVNSYAKQAAEISYDVVGY